ncbi:sensor histidine kinase [Paramicrobacterium sp. CJ85]|uniref:sensor histidine kinase n=1 Tax=Paramicrobacterium sp. CJ85 TaxID=3445355 RepID=UPI003F5E8C19
MSGRGSEPLGIRSSHRVPGGAVVSSSIKREDAAGRRSPAPLSPEGHRMRDTTTPSTGTSTGASTGATDAAVLATPPRWSTWLDGILTRIGLATPLSRDIALAALIAISNLVLTWSLIAFLDAAGGSTFSAPHLTAILVVSTAQAAPLCLRRSHPTVAFALVAATQVALVGLFPPGVGISGLAPLIAAYTVGTLLPAARAVATIAVVGALEAAASLAVKLYIATPLYAGAPNVLNTVLGRSSPTPLPLQYLADAGSTFLTYGIAVLIGITVASHRRYLTLVRVRAAEAIREQHERADAAITAERSRMARELHDIAAHHLSGMVVQSAAIERLIDKDPDAAKEATAWVRSQGKETLANLRLVVGVLREPHAETQDAGEHTAPVPGLAVVDDLVGTARALGTHVEFTRSGTAFPLPPVADVTVYRVLQEALANARQHAPGAPVTVALRYTDTAVALEVENAASPTPTHDDTRRGLGLIGMRERAQLIGATFAAASTPSGGWRVTLTVPAEPDTDHADSALATDPGSALATDPGSATSTDHDPTEGAPA